MAVGLKSQYIALYFSRMCFKHKIYSYDGFFSVNKQKNKEYVMDIYMTMHCKHLFKNLGNV